MASFWQQMPFIRIIIPFILGIILVDQTSVDACKYLLLLPLTGILLLLKTKLPLPAYLKGLWYNSILFVLGITCLFINNYLLHYNHFSKTENSFLCIQIVDKPQKTSKGFKAECAVLYGIDSNSNQNRYSGKIQVYFKDSLESSIPVYGDQFIIKSSFQEISSPRNPAAFNYKNYMARKGVFHQTFLDRNKYFLTGENNGYFFYKKVVAFQKFIKEVLRNNLKQEDEIAIAEALLYGYDKDISDDITTAYSRTGTLHVLAVSGMHVGLIFMLLSLFLKPLEKEKKGKFWVAIINLVGIWTYSVICGFTPSILRATVMFSFIIIGKLIQRGGNPFNSLAASAMLLLIIDPQLLYNVGFQLSYSAVLGILGFYQNFYLLLTFKHNWMDEIWKIISVSVAAQVLTLPMSIYYFHQIPNYFIIANLAIIPISSIIIYAGIALLVISPFQLLSIYLGKLIGVLIQLLNNIALWIAALPGAYFDHINWNGTTLIFTYLIILCFIIYLSYRDLLFLRLVIFIMVLLQVNIFYQHSIWIKQNYVVIYQMKQGFGVEVMQQKNSFVYSNLTQLKDSKIFTQIFLPNQYKHGIENTTFNEVDSGNLYLEINQDCKIFLIQNNVIPQNQNIEIVVLSGNKYQDIRSLIMHNKIKQIVLNQDIMPKKRAAIKKILTTIQIPYHDIKENGAFELSL